MNTIVIEFCPEDRARLDKIIAGLDGLQHDCNKCVDTALAAMKNNIADMSPAENATTPAPAEPVKEHKYKLSDVQKKVVELSAAGKKAQVREIVKSYAERVVQIPEDKCDEVMARMAALEG